MLYKMVPTCENELIIVGGVAIALIANTSLSGKLKRTMLSQLRFISSTQFVPLNLTMSPTSG